MKLLVQLGYREDSAERSIIACTPTVGSESGSFVALQINTHL